MTLVDPRAPELAHRWTIVSFDTGFDRFAGVRRLAPPG